MHMVIVKITRVLWGHCSWLWAQRKIMVLANDRGPAVVRFIFTHTSGVGIYQELCLLDIRIELDSSYSDIQQYLVVTFCYIHNDETPRNVQLETKLRKFLDANAASLHVYLV